MASLSHSVKVSMFCDSILKLRNQCLSKGPGSFRPWVVSPVSRFARESFRPGSFRPVSFRPWIVSPLFGESFRPYFSTMPKCNLVYYLLFCLGLIIHNCLLGICTKGGGCDENRFF